MRNEGNGATQNPPGEIVAAPLPRQEGRGPGDPVSTAENLTFSVVARRGPPCEMLSAMTAPGPKRTESYGKPPWR